VAIEVVENAASTVTLYPDGAPPSSATASFYSPEGNVLSTPSVSVQAIGSGGVATVGTVTDQTTIAVDDATNISMGDRLWYSSSRGWAGPVMVSEINGLNIVLESPPPGTARVGDTLVGLKLSATIAAADTGTRKMNHRVEWSVAGSDSVTRTYQTMVHVVRVQFTPDRIVSSTDAARYLSSTFPAYATSVDGGHFSALASRAAARVLRMLRATGNYPHLIGDQDAFQDAGLVALRIECAMTDGLVPGGYDPAIYVHEQEKHLASLVRETVANMWVDHDDDGIVEEDTELSYLFAMTARRL
jgi:hypothetical protein